MDEGTNAPAHEMRILNHTGDIRLAWNSEKKEEVKHAKATFEEWRGKGYLAFKPKRDGSPGEQIHTFDPDAEAIILQPALVGG